VALFEQVYELDLEGIVDKDSHAPLTPRIVSKAPGKLRPTLNLTLVRCRTQIVERATLAGRKEGRRIRCRSELREEAS